MTCYVPADCGGCGAPCLGLSLSHVAGTRAASRQHPAPGSSTRGWSSHPLTEMSERVMSVQAQPHYNYSYHPFLQLSISFTQWWVPCKLLSVGSGSSSDVKLLAIYHWLLSGGHTILMITSYFVKKVHPYSAALHLCFCAYKMLGGEIVCFCLFNISSSQLAA